METESSMQCGGYVDPCRVAPPRSGRRWCARPHLCACPPCDPMRRPTVVRGEGRHPKSRPIEQKKALVVARYSPRTSGGNMRPHFATSGSGMSCMYGCLNCISHSSDVKSQWQIIRPACACMQAAPPYSILGKVADGTPPPQLAGGKICLSVWRKSTLAESWAIAAGNGVWATPTVGTPKKTPRIQEIPRYEFCWQVVWLGTARLRIKRKCVFRWGYSGTGGP